MKRGTLLFLVLVGLLFSKAGYADIDVKTIIDNIEKGDKQSVLSGPVGSLAIKRGPAEFILGPGRMTLFDFGSGRVAGLVYEGQGAFYYLPPDDVETYQMRRFTGADTLRGTFGRIAIFFTVELAELPDTSSFQRGPVESSAWKQIDEARSGLYEHMNLNVASAMMGDLLANGPGTYFNAFFELGQSGEFVFIENPISGDLYTFSRLNRRGGAPTYDMIQGYSPDEDLPSQRGVAAIDITHYSLDSHIETGGQMTVNCRLYFTPLRWGQRYVYMNWYHKNKLLSAVDSRGDTLTVIHKDTGPGIFTTKFDESGFGLVFDKPFEIGIRDSLDITFECKSLENIYGMFALSGQTYWYPQNSIRDAATFELKFDCPKSFSVVACGDLESSSIENGRHRSTWRADKPVHYVSFNIGDFETRDFVVDSLAPVRVYLSKTYPHDQLALQRAYYGELSTGDMLGSVGADVTNSLAFYSSIFGPCPFDTVRAVELLFTNAGQGSPGLIHLSSSTFQADDMGGYDESFRAHEVAHQWWGHVIDNESYRDTWITEGLAEYCGFWFYQMSSRDKGSCDRILGFWKSLVMSGYKFSDGYKAGPVVAGTRLSSSKSDDYQIVVYEKGAYIFHMIRYLLHDYKTGSDDAFAAFLKDLATKYRGKIITTEKLRQLLEEHAGGDMSWFFKQWVYGTQIPEYTFSFQATETPESKYQVSCHIKQDKVPPDFQMVVPLTLLFEGDKYIHLKVLVDQPEMDIDLPLLPLEPKKILFNTYNAVLCEVKTK